jgi:pyruvate kinase
VRDAARTLGHRPFIIAKIERAGALDHYDEILSEADGVMVARGDLGVEVPIESIAITQKSLIARANLAGKPVITATQMLESMVASRIPTRAEATDVANAILDGTDAVMLSAESAVGRFPEEAVAMLAKIAAATEAQRGAASINRLAEFYRTHRPATTAEATATVVEQALQTVPCDAVIVPTRTGSTARMLARFKPSVWTVAVSADAAVCQGLAFSYGVDAVETQSEPEDWRAFAGAWAREHGLSARSAMLVAGPSATHPDANYRIEFMRLAGTV